MKLNKQQEATPEAIEKSFMMVVLRQKWEIVTGGMSTPIRGDFYGRIHTYLPCEKRGTTVLCPLVEEAGEGNTDSDISGHTCVELLPRAKKTRPTKA